MPIQIADVLLPLALDQTYSYLVPSDIEIAEGALVHVPFGHHERVGVVWALHDQEPGSNLKHLISVLDSPPLPLKLRLFLDFVASYTLAPRGAVLALALKRFEESPYETARIGLRLKGEPPKRLTPARMRVLEVVKDGQVHLKKSLSDLASVSSTVLDGLVDEGTLEAVSLPPEPVALAPVENFNTPVLSETQADAARFLRQAVQEQNRGVTLLEGITGSGKTEVYFEAVAEAICQGKQALILMPEIALTAGFLERFKARFGVFPASWHSGVSGRKREKLYRAISQGSAQVMAGARSALFLPYHSLGVIIVDEEHEGAYKQEDGVHYHARDMAVMRGHIEHCPVILASATPSLESHVNARRGRYHHLLLPKRFSGQALPDIKAIDLRAHPLAKGQFLSGPLIDALNETFAKKEQALLFLNRRGYAPLTLCRTCGHRYECPNCSAWLVEHRFRKALVCHHCGHTERRPDSCVACGSVDSLAACGPGVERVAEEAAHLFPDKRIVVLSSDMGGLERLRQQLEIISAGECDLIIGTQLVAKGHHFPHLTLVGVMDADIGLVSGDPRASERTFQILQQVTGRAGRATKAGRALLQTYQPTHPVIAALISGETERFYTQERDSRERAGLPPFGRLAAIIISGSDRVATEAYARALSQVAQVPDGAVMWGPAEAPLFLLKGRYRYRLLVKTRRDFDMQRFLRDWMSRVPKITGDKRLRIDVDPQSFF